jgi:cytochrome P450
MSTESAGASGNTSLFSPALLQDPYPAYHRLRATAPVYWDPSTELWLLSGYRVVEEALMDERISADRVSVMKEWLPGWEREELAPLYRTLDRQLLFKDGEDHRRLRGLVNRAFTPRVVERLRPRIQSLVDEMLDAVQASGRMDVIGDLAYPLPAIVVSLILGVPPEDRHRFKRWSDDLASFLGLHASPSAEVAERTRASMAEATEYFQAAIAAREGDREEDLLGTLIAAEEDLDRLSEEEVIANSILILAAGHETTTNLIGNGMLALLRHPEQMQRLRNDPALIESAVEECLRFDSPVQLLVRTAREDFTLEGKRLDKGQGMLLLLGAANRDPEQFPQPDQLDVGREENRHLAFGHGPHYCFGAALARLEGEVAISTMLRRMPRLAMESGPLEWNESFAFRGLKSLPVRL